MADFIEAVVDAVVAIVKFLMNLILDFLAISVIIMCLPAIWRWPFYPACWDECNGNETRVQMRYFAIYLAGTVLFDLITLVPFALCLCSWRFFFVLNLIWDRQQNPHSPADAAYNFSARVGIWLTFAYLFADMLALFALAVEHIPIWRIPRIWSKILKEMNEYGFELIPCCIAKDKGPDPSSDFRAIIASEFLPSIGDLLTAVLGLPVAVMSLCCIWRMPNYIHQVGYFLNSSSSSSDRIGFNPIARLYGYYIIFVEIPLDIVTVFSFFISHLAVWRLGKMYSKISKSLSDYGTALWPSSLLSDSSNSPVGAQQVLQKTKSVTCDFLGCCSFRAVDTWDISDNGIRQAIILEGCVYGFAETFVNLITLPLFLITIPTWRVLRMFREIRYAHDEEEEDSVYSWMARYAVISNFFLTFFVDIPVLFAFLLSHAVFWRVPKVYVVLYSEYKQNGSELLPWTQQDPREECLKNRPPNQKQPVSLKNSLRYPETEYRVAIMWNFLSSFILFFSGTLTSPFLAVCLCMFWRIPFLLRGLFDCWSTTAAKPSSSSSPTTTSSSSSSHPRKTASAAGVVIDVNAAEGNNNNILPPNATAQSSQASTPQTANSVDSVVSNPLSVDLLRKSSKQNNNNSTSADNNDDNADVNTGYVAYGYTTTTQQQQQESNFQETTTTTTLKDLDPSSIDWIPFQVIWKTSFYCLLDVITFVIFIFSHISIVRIPLLYSAVSEHFNKEGSPLLPWTIPNREFDPISTKFRFIFISQCAHALVELILLPFIALIAITVYRIGPTVKYLKHSSDDHVQQKLFILEQAVYVFCDVFSLIPALIVLLSGLRTATFWNDVSDLNEQVEQDRNQRIESLKREEAEIQANSTNNNDNNGYGSASSSSAVGQRQEEQQESNNNENINNNANVSSSTARNNNDNNNNSSSSPEHENIIRQKVLSEKIAKDIRKFNDEWTSEFRMLTWSHFLFFFRDLLLLPFALVVLGTLYRAWFLIMETKQKVSRWARVDDVKFDITEIKLEPPSNNRPNGVVLRIKGTKKDPNFVIPDDCVDDIKFFIRGDSGFWDGISSSFGAMTATVGQQMLPLIIKKEYFNPSRQIFQNQNGEMELLFDFDISPKTKSILKNLNKISYGVTCILSCEYGSSHNGTLFVASCKMNELASSLQQDGKYSANFDKTFDFVSYAGAKWRGERFVDVWWKIALMQFGMILVDILTLVAFLLLHAFPHRIIPFYYRACESPQRRRERKFISTVDELQFCVNEFPTHVEQFLQKVSNAIKSTPNYTNHGTVQRIVSSFVSEINQEGGFSNVSHKILEREHDEIATKMMSIVEKHNSFSAALSTNLDQILVAKFPQDQHQNKRNNRKQYSSSSYTEQVTSMASKILSSTLSYATTLLKNNNNSISTNVPPTAPNASSASASSSAARSQKKQNDDVGGDGSESDEKKKKRLLLDSMNSLELDARFCNAVLDKAKELQKSSTADLEEHIKPTLQNVGECCSVSKSDGVQGIRVDLVDMWWQLLLDIVPMICFFITCCTIYRAPWLIRRVAKSHSPRKECINGFFEIFVDIGYFIMYGCSMLSIRAVFALNRDLLRSIYYMPNFGLCRLLILHHWSLLLRDLAALFEIIFSCEAIKFVLASSIFGFLAPGVLIEGSIMQGDSETSSDVCRAGLVLLFGLFFMFGLPVVFAKSVSVDNAAAPAIYFGSFLALFFLIGVIISLVRQRPRVVSCRRPVLRNVKPNWHNMSNFFWIFVEFVQLMFIAFGTTALSGSFGPSTSETMIDISRGVFLDFLRWGSNVTVTRFNVSGDNTNTTEFVVTKANLPVGVSFSLAIVLIYFLLLTLPVVTGYILKWHEGKKLLTNSLWGSTVKVIGFVSAIFVSKNLGEALACQSGAGGTMILQPDLVCWTDAHHLDTTLALMIFSVFFYLSTLTHNVIFDEAAASANDVVTAELFRHLTQAPMCIVAFLSSILQQHENSSKIILGMLIASSVWCLLCCFLYGKLLNKDEGAFCTLRIVELLRIALYFSVLVCAILCLVAIPAATSSSQQQAEKSNMWVIYVSIGVSVFSFIVAFCYAEYFSPRDAKEDSIDECRNDLLTIEENLVEEGKMTATWIEMRKAWRKKVETALRVSTLAAASVHLESGIYSIHLQSFYLQTRAKWKQDVNNLIDRTEKDDDVRFNEFSWKVHQDNNSDASSFSSCSCSLECCCRPCIFCCCVWKDHGGWGSGSSDDDEIHKEENVDALSLVVQTLSNALATTTQQASFVNQNIDDDDEDGDDNNNNRNNQQVPSAIISSSSPATSSTHHPDHHDNNNYNIHSQNKKSSYQQPQWGSTSSSKTKTATKTDDDPLQKPLIRVGEDIIDLENRMLKIVERFQPGKRHQESKKEIHELISSNHLEKNQGYPSVWMILSLQYGFEFSVEEEEKEQQKQKQKQEETTMCVDMTSTDSWGMSVKETKKNDSDEEESTKNDDSSEKKDEDEKNDNNDNNNNNSMGDRDWSI